MNRTESWKQIREAIEEIKIVDSHEHLRNPFAANRPVVSDVISFLTAGYLSADLISAGMKLHLVVKERDQMENGKVYTEEESVRRWEELEPHLENVQNASYYRYLLIALRNLFGLEDEEVDGSNWKTVSQRISEKTKDHVSWSQEILDKMNIYRAILDISKGRLPDRNIIRDERLVQVVRMDGFITYEPQIVGTFTKRKAHSLDDYLSILDEAFEKVVKAGAVGIKSGLAYRRIIFYDKIAKSDAERIFIKGINNLEAKERRMFEDFMMHEVCKRCAEHNLPFQIHTGIQAGVWNTLTNAKPTHLTNLFKEFPDVIFDLFHGGYPYMQEAGLMAKYFPNVYLDACWLAHISPAAYKRGLDEWLEILPANKIFAWGGDYGIIEHSYASLMLAKDLISEVLANKVDSGYFTMKVAKSVAKKILGENATKVYSL